MRTLGIALLLFILTPPAVAGENALTETRSALEAVIEPLLRCYREDSGPSMTAQFARLIACGDPQVRAVLAEAWKAARVPDSRAWRASDELEQVARFLYRPGKVAKRKVGGLRFVDGALVQWVLDSSDGSRGRYRPDLPPLADLIGGKKLRPLPAPDGTALLARVRAGRPNDWSSTEWTDLCRALGEAAGRDGEVLTGLLGLWRKTPEDRPLLAALRRTGSPRAALALQSRCRGLLERLSTGDDTMPWRRVYDHPLRLTGRAWLAIDPDALRELLSKLPAPSRVDCLRACGLDHSLPILLDAIETAGSREERFQAGRELREVVLGQASTHNPLAADMPRAIRALLDLLEQANPNETEWLTETVAWLFFLERADRPWAIPGPDVLTRFRQLAGDVDAGRLVFLDEKPGILDPPVRPLGGSGERARSNVPVPIPGLTDPDPRFPVHLVAEWVESGLRFTLSNRGQRPFLINPVMLSYCTARLTPEKIARAGPPLPVSQLSIEFGYVSAPVGVPREALLTLEPGENYRWTHPVRPEHRDVDHIAVRLPGYCQVIGGTELPYLRWLNTSWVK